MVNKEAVIPYKVEKGNRPEIELVIENCLDDELRKPALAFASWMRKEKMSFIEIQEAFAVLILSKNPLVQLTNFKLHKGVL